MEQKLNILLVLIFIIPGLLSAQNWREINTANDVCSAYPELVKDMFENYNLSYPGLEQVKSAYNNGHLEEACLCLLKYYKNCNNALHLRAELPNKSIETEALADTILSDVFTIQNVRGKVPWGDDGHRNWYYKGPNNDLEWAWLSNRHSQINHVLSVFLATGNSKYTEYIDLFLRDFILKSMPYPAKKSRTSVWRGLEVAARIKVWSRIFYKLLNCEGLSDATRILMLSSFPDHGHYNRNFHAQNNWLTMEISALATLATNFPEYKKSGEWLDYSIATMAESMRGQVYADGAQTELTAHYHIVALKNFELLKAICDRVQKPMPEFFSNTLKKMYNYTASMVRPDGNRALNNDGDRGSDVDLILGGATKFNQPDWEYIATNGRAGTLPADGPSYFFPWAGHLISRSSFEKNAHWSLFDVGPWGTGHQHNDKMHISISAYGRDLLVDAGRFAYTGEIARKFRAYAKGTQGHNSVLIDEKGQMPDVRIIDEPLSEKHWKITLDFDYAWNSYDKYYDLKEVKHNRALMYIRGEFWVVVDRIESKQNRKIETLWHWHPECSVEIEKDGVISTKNQSGNLAVIPVGKADWKVEVIEGQENPEIQGWYSEKYNKFCSNKAVIHSTTIDENETFVWLLIPSDNKAPIFKAKIISKNEHGVELVVSSKKKGKWNLKIPFADSKNVMFEFAR